MTACILMLVRVSAGLCVMTSLSPFAILVSAVNVCVALPLLSVVSVDPASDKVEIVLLRIRPCPLVVRELALPRILGRILAMILGPDLGSIGRSSIVVRLPTFLPAVPGPGARLPTATRSARDSENR